MPSLTKVNRNLTMQKTSSLAEIAALLERANSVLAMSHISPDGDAIGSLLGLGWLIRHHAERRGAPVEISLVSADGVPEQFMHLPGASEIQRAVPTRSWDAVVALDASDPLRLGEPFRPETRGDAPVVNLDHHVTNLRFGTYNYVDFSAAATSQIVVDLADTMGVPISRQMAECLLTGLTTDTLAFRTSNVTSDVMRLAARLMDEDANLAEIVTRSLTQRPLSEMRLWGLALSRLQSERNAVWTEVSNEMRGSVDAVLGAESGLANFLLGAPEADVAAVFSETPDGRVEISFRSRPGTDVSALALSLGGGGHPQAAGCALPGTLHEVQGRVIPKLVALSDSSHNASPTGAEG